MSGLRERVERIALQMSRDKADTLMLLGAALLVLTPHALHLPLWVSALCATTLLWRGVITFRGTRMPPGMLLVPLAAAAMAGVYMTFKTILGREAGVAMLVLLVAFKMLEMHARRDLFVVIFLCFFLVLTNFFYSQSIATALLMVASVIALLTAQLSFQFTGAVPPLARRVKMGLKIFMLAAPLAAVLFFVFPRIQGPLWGLPGDSGGATSGLSGSMAPGNLSNLAQSDEPAFRVKFKGPTPPPVNLYWRGVVMGDFDGRTWTPVKRRDWPGRPNINIAVTGPAVHYEVTLEPNNQRWLFALDLPRELPQLTANASRINSEMEVTATDTITQRVRYAASSHLNYRLQPDEVLPESEIWLALPRGYNPRAVAAGLALQREPDQLARVKQVLARFGTEGYSYTLEPPLLGEDSVDDFLYKTKLGFCEHYASAFVFLMRAADIPARVVTGYQGGEVNPVDGFMTVRQSDAHAWAEVWLPGRGWIRVDPTAAVSPDRILGQRTRAQLPTPAFSLEGFGSLMNIDLDRNSWLGQLRFQLAALNNGWNQWVLNYTPERQRNFMQSLQDILMNWHAPAAVLALFFLIFVARAIRLRSEIDPVDALYSALCQQFGRLGLARAGDEGPNAYALRIAEADMPPGRKDAAVNFLRLYSSHKYGNAAADSALVQTLKRLLASTR